MQRLVLKSISPQLAPWEQRLVSSVERQAQERTHERRAKYAQPPNQGKADVRI